MNKVIKKTVVKKYQNGGMTNAEKVAANKKKVEANAKKVQANREKVYLGKTSPNSTNYKSSGDKYTYTASNSKGDLAYKNTVVGSGPTSKGTMYTAYDKPRVTTGTGGILGNEKKITSAQSMDTTGYAAGKKTFVMNTKKAIPGAGDMYKQSSRKVSRKDVPKELKKMQTFRKGGSIKPKKK